MLLCNDTPFAAMGFGQLHRDGAPMAVVCARATFNLMPSGELVLAKQQEIVLSDVYEGDPHRTPLIRVGDLIPHKPAADVTVIGTAQAPRGRPATSWEVAVAIGSQEVRLRVHGPRQWEPALKLLKPTWKLGVSEPTTTVPVDYRYAAGGRFVGEPEGAADLRNLIGPGILHKDWSRIGVPLRAPQIDSLRSPVADPFATPQPQGFGPIPPFWSVRQKYAGTYDEAWRSASDRSLPADFDYRFYQTAHGDLVLPHLVGDETVRLEGMTPDGALAFHLPDRVLVARHTWSDGRRQVPARMTLDGLHLDLRQPAGPWRADLTWRGWVGLCPAYLGAILEFATPGDTSDLPVSREHGLAEPEAVG